MNEIVYSPNKYRETEGVKVDITISFANEYGQKASIVLYAVEILDEQSGFSIDNVTSEKACSFVARRVEYMKPVDRNGSTVENASPVPMSNGK